MIDARAALAALLFATSALAAPSLGLAQAAPPARPWADRSLSPDARANLLVEQLTFEEKISLVHGFFPPLAKGGPANMVPSAGHVPGVPRLGIPALKETDASLGVANQVEQRKGDVATALPASLATAATFNPQIAHDGGAMIGSEARAKGFNAMLAGGVNLTRDPWNGRNFEYLGEDPLLAGIMAGAAIAGVQSNHVVSTVKHYALNSQETGRMIVDARLDEAALRESDLLAFEIAIERGDPGSVMCAYNLINGHWACENDILLNKVLKGDWGYKGWVMSDWGAVHSTDKAANTGLDQESGQELDSAIFFSDKLAASVKAGRVSQARLDDMVRRILRGMIAHGVMDDPVPAVAQAIDYAPHAEVAQRAAEEGIVLLKNDAGLLPLAKSARRIVLIGAHADVGVLSGGGSSQVRSVGGVPVEIPLTSGPSASFCRITWHSSSPLKAIRAIAPGAQLTYVDGLDPKAAAAAAKGADAVVVFAWQWQTEATDAETLSLPDNQDALIAAVAAANPKTTVVLETGGPVLMPWLDRVNAVVEAWYPGQRGGEAIARVLFGEVNPSGRLPITFPADASQPRRPTPPGLAELKASEAAATAAANPGSAAPAVAAKPFAVTYDEGSDVGYRDYAKRGIKPLFPFGHGLSYTRFSYGGLQVEGMTVSFDVRNIGGRPGADTPQVYVTPPGRSPRLAGWSKVALAPGETRRVTVRLEPRILASYDTNAPGWRIDAGAYPVTVGRFAGDRTLAGTADVAARRIKP